MGKLRLDYFLSVGGKLVDGDVFIGSGGDRFEIGMHCSDVVANSPSDSDNKRFVESFAPRKNEGAMPCDGGFPVVGHWFVDGTDDDSAGQAKHFDWKIKNYDKFELEFWQPDLVILIRRQDKHDATLSKTETVQPKPSVYTQAMADAGELPIAGMECMILNAANSRLKYEVANVNYIGDATCVFNNKGCPEQARLKSKLKFKPIDTRTEREKVIDGIVYDIEDRINNCDTPKDAAKEIYNQYIAKK